MKNTETKLDFEFATNTFKNVGLFSIILPHLYTLVYLFSIYFMLSFIKTNPDLTFLLIGATLCILGLFVYFIYKGFFSKQIIKINYNSNVIHVSYITYPYSEKYNKLKEISIPINKFEIFESGEGGVGSKIIFYIHIKYLGKSYTLNSHSFPKEDFDFLRDELRFYCKNKVKDGWGRGSYNEVQEWKQKLAIRQKLHDEAKMKNDENKNEEEFTN